MSNNATPQQLHLNVSLRDDATFDNFFLPEDSRNQQALATLTQELSSPAGSLIYLWGVSGCGLTHLLQAACHKIQGNGFSGMYLPLQDLVGYEPRSLLEGLEHQHLICLDGLESIAGNAQWETGLFALYNQVKERQHHLLLAAKQGPHQIPIALPDLQSRFSSGYTYQIEALVDKEKISAIQIRAKARGIEMSDEVAQFILNRAPREMGELFDLLDKLDELSLSAQRRLTVPFVKEALGW